ncbi:hypothetical protein FPQ18DRAFT_57660 [Pyronema domesticum]|nr:hypothetical protein FPQ18DRAFT_57660 [Pyronema domesticum]
MPDLLEARNSFRDHLLRTSSRLGRPEESLTGIAKGNEPCSGERQSIPAAARPLSYLWRWRTAGRGLQVEDRCGRRSWCCPLLVGHLNFLLPPLSLPASSPDCQHQAARLHPQLLSSCSHLLCCCLDIFYPAVDPFKISIASKEEKLPSKLSLIS